MNVAERYSLSGLLAMAVVSACLVLFGPVPWARGGTGMTVSLPLGNKPAPHGLRLSVDCEWVQGYGYRPIRIDVTCPTKLKSDHTLTLEVGLGNGWSDECDIVTTTEIALPAGSSSASTVLTMPQLTYSVERIDVKTWLDGAPIEKLTAKNLSISNGSYGHTTIPRTLFIAAKAPDVSEMSFLARSPYSPYTVAIDFSQLSNVSAFVHRVPERLTEKWLDYSALDVVFISLADARDLAAGRPAAWRALTDWQRCGGTLCVFGVGSDWHGLKDVERLTRCPADEEEAAGPFRGWQVPTRDVFENEVLPAIDEAQRAARDAQISMGQKPPAVSPPPDMPAEIPFAWKPVALGRVVAIAAAQPFPGEAASWQWMFHSVSPYEEHWTARYGTAPDQPNTHFNDFLIADVGLPPIRTYQVLISVFVVGIGPLNYWLLRRRGRLHLFVFTVPLAALVTSFALLGYVLLADGFVSRLRARSFTHLDQRAGEATHVARLSYYLGLAPRRGLTFPEDTMVAPLELTQPGRFSQPSRHIGWDQGQHLTRGWLSSRMPTQYVTARAHTSERGLDVATAGNSKRCAVRNRLGTHIQHLVLCDENGNLHHTTSLPDGERATLTALETKEDTEQALLGVTRALRRNAPAYPEGMFEGQQDDFSIFSSRYFRPSQEFGIDPSRSLLERKLFEALTAIRSQSLEPRSYVAIVTRPQEIATGLENLVETQSLHVIRGTW